jgi:hypothetical protein
MSDLSEYRAMIARKKVAFEPRGIKVDESDLPAGLFDHQRHSAAFALRAGSAALYLDTGLGKTYSALVWGDAIVKHSNKPVLMMAPLAVAQQHVREAERVGIEAKLSRTGEPPKSPMIVVSNYERLERFDPQAYAGVILDESSILKSYTGGNHSQADRGI